MVACKCIKNGAMVSRWLVKASLNLLRSRLETQSVCDQAGRKLGSFLEKVLLFYVFSSWVRLYEYVGYVFFSIRYTKSESHFKYVCLDTYVDITRS